MTAFSFQLVTPERVLWSGEADAVSMRTDVGEATFLANHTSLVGALDITVLRITPSDAGGGEQRAAVHGGFVHVDQNEVVVAAPVAELAEEIDAARARRALADAEQQVAAGAPAGEPAPARASGAGGAGAGGAGAGGAGAGAGRADADDVAGAGAGAGDADESGRGAFLDPASPEARRRRAEVRLAAAGADPAT